MPKTLQIHFLNTSKGKILKTVLLSVLLSSSILFHLKGQELNCLVKVNADAIQITEKGIFSDMEKSFAQFMNNRKWTNDQFKNHERINCFLNITLQRMPSIGVFEGTVQIQASRPVFNTNYETIVLNFADRSWLFEYTESLPLEFNENSLVSNLTSMLAYYAYIIIGLDYDTFSKKGGAPYFEKANNIVTIAQQSGDKGWNQFEGNRNRYWLIENIQNPQMEPIREALYTYHRQGMDIFEKDPDEARKKIAACLKDIQSVNKLRPNSILTISFLDAKRNEIIQIFSKGDNQVRREAFEALKQLDPNKTSDYEKILK